MENQVFIGAHSHRHPTRFLILHGFGFLSVYLEPPEGFSPPPKDAGSNIGVRVSLGDNGGLQFPNYVQLHHPIAELQEHGQRAGGGKNTVSHDGGMGDGGNDQIRSQSHVSNHNPPCLLFLLGEDAAYLLIHIATS